MWTTAVVSIIVICIFFLLSAVIGLLSRKRAGSEAGYFLASRSLGTVNTTATLSATVIGGSATILVIGQVYANGLSFIWTDIAGGLGLILLGLILAKKVRNLGCYTLPEIAGLQYGPSIRRASALFIVLAEIGFLALLLRASATLLAPVTSMGDNAALLLVAGVFTFYTVIGGQFAVARTDLFQLVLMLFGLVTILLPTVIVTADWHVVPAGHLQFPVSGNFTPGYLLSLIVISGLPHFVGSDIYSKLLSARDGSVARRAAIWSGALKIVIGLCVGIIGLAAVSLVPEGTAPASVLPVLIFEVLPEPVAVISILAFLATLMSSADSVMLTAGTVISRDLFGFSGKKGLIAGRFATAAVAAAGVLLAVWLGSLLSIFFFAYTLFSAALVPPVLLGFWRDRLRLDRTSAFAAMAGGMLMVIIGRILGWPSEYITLSGIGISVIILLRRSICDRKLF